jgi:AcrR family transcriptional regulator
MAVIVKIISEATERPTKRDQIVEAASELFLELGYGLTSMDAVAAAANVSKRTVYSHFQNKETLFIDIMDNMCHRFGEGAIDTLNFEAPPAEFLRAAGRFLISKVTEPRLLSLMRAIVSQVTTFPEMGREFWATGPGNFRNVVAEYLKAQHAAGTLSVPDPPLSASQFQGLMAGPQFLPLLFTGDSEYPNEESERLIAVGVAMFLAGHAPTSRPVDLPARQQDPSS